MIKTMKLVREILDGYNASLDRRKNRVRRAKLTGIVTVITKGISTTAGLISIPLTAQYLGTERFGLWLLLSSLLSCVNLFDLGLANSLANSLAIADGREDRTLAKEIVSSAFYSMLGGALILTVLFGLFYSSASWEKVLNIRWSQPQLEIELAIAICFGVFIIHLLCSLSSRIYRGYQEEYISQLWLGLGSLLSIIGLIVSIHLKANFPALLAVFLGFSLLGDILAAIHLFWFRRKWLKPNLNYYNLRKTKWLFKTGFQFWLAQISSFLVFQTDLIIVSKLFGASAVANYGVVLKLFTLVGSIQSAFVAPLWSAYAEAGTRGDFFWVNQAFKKSVCFSVIWSSCIGVLLAINTPNILKIWLNQTEAVDKNLIFAMLLTTILVSVAQSISMLANGLGETDIQAFVGPIAAISNLILSVVLGLFLGVSGVAWATMICVLVFSVGIVGMSVVKRLQANLKTCQKFY